MHCCGRAAHSTKNGWCRRSQQCVVGETRLAQLAQRAAAKTKHQRPVGAKHVSSGGQSVAAAKCHLSVWQGIDAQSTGGAVLID